MPRASLSSSRYSDAARLVRVRYPSFAATLKPPTILASTTFVLQIMTRELSTCTAESTFFTLFGRKRYAHRLKPVENPASLPLMSLLAAECVFFLLNHRLSVLVSRRTRSTPLSAVSGTTLTRSCRSFGPLFVTGATV